MYEKLVAFKEWCEDADEKVFWFGFITATAFILIGQAVWPVWPFKAENEPSQIAFEGMQVAGEMVNTGLHYLEERYLPEQSFDDVPTDYWAYDEIELIYSYGITVGCSYDPPLYCPDRAATRAEMAVFAARIIELIEKGCE